MSQPFFPGGPLSVSPLHQSLQKEEPFLKVDASLLQCLLSTDYTQALCWVLAIAVSRQAFIHLETIVTSASFFLLNYHCVEVTKYHLKVMYAHVYSHRTQGAVSDLNHA